MKKGIANYLTILEYMYMGWNTLKQTADCSFWITVYLVIDSKKRS